MAKEKLKVGIIGVTGYTGEELLFLLERHPVCELVFATSTHADGAKLGHLYPWATKFREMEICSLQRALDIKVDVIFFCLPAGESVKWAEIFLQKGIKIIDLGADFRFDDPADFNLWYHFEHPSPGLLKHAVYGLPEINRSNIKNAQIVGNPGCYATSILLALAPFCSADILAERQIIIDSKSGVSGAGKTPTLASHFVEVNETASAYLPGRNHRHIGEIEQELNKIAPGKIRIVFTPHLIPMSRGLLSTIYIPLKHECESTELLEMIFDFHRDEPFIRVLFDKLPKTSQVLRSNFCFLGLKAAPGINYAILLSAIDNLGKGASWQAVQNMNIMFGFAETTGLLG